MVRNPGSVFSETPFGSLRPRRSWSHSRASELQRGAVLEGRDRRDRQAARHHAPEHRDVLSVERAQIGGQGLGIARRRGIDDDDPPAIATSALLDLKAGVAAPGLLV